MPWASVQPGQARCSWQLAWGCSGARTAAKPGRTWKLVVSPLTYARDVQVSPHDPKVLYACLSPAARSRDGSLYRSQDLGQSWKRFDHDVTPHSTMMTVSMSRQDPSRSTVPPGAGRSLAHTMAGRPGRSIHCRKVCRTSTPSRVAKCFGDVGSRAVRHGMYGGHTLVECASHACALQAGARLLHSKVTHRTPARLSRLARCPEHEAEFLTQSPALPAPGAGRN